MKEEKSYQVRKQTWLTVFENKLVYLIMDNFVKSQGSNKFKQIP